MNTPRASLGHLLVAWPLLATAYRAVLAAQEGLPVARQGLKLVRAEARLARESVPGVLWASVLSLVGFWILLGALVAGAVTALVAAGWALAWAILLPAAVGLVALLGGAFWAWRGVERLSFVHSRERLKALLEVIDED
jgi:hypothetical protein